jgi:hypothetical protein
MTRRAAFLCCLLVMTATAGFAADYGLLLDQGAEYTEDKTGDSHSYEAILIPWWSSPLWDKEADMYLSASLSALQESSSYEDDTERRVIPELKRAEFAWRPRGGMELSLGRIRYSDPLGLVASGLFDGAAFRTEVGSRENPLSGELSIGMFYSGFLYKETANITMTADDMAAYHTPLDYKDFGDTYFAPSRFLGALGYTLYPGSLIIDFNVLAQHDMTGGENRYDSRYFQAKISLPYKSLFIVEAGGTMELIETTGGLTPGILGKLGLTFMPPTDAQDSIKVGLRCTSGNSWGGDIAAFTPVSTISQGRILQAKLSGLAAAELGYTVRLHQTLALRLEGLYFMRTDLTTYTAWPAQGDSYHLGTEACAQLIWSPFSDLRLDAGGGAFIPTADSGYRPRWHIQIGAILALL